MESLMPFVPPLVALVILACLWRAVFLVRHREAAAAIVFRTDFEEASQSWFRSGDGGVTVNELIRFADRSGAYHEVEMMRVVSRWWGPDVSHMVWYDPADPRRVTDLGPRHWIGLSLGLCFALWMLLDPGAASALLSVPGRPS